jgi:hypothetical protein
VNLPEHKAVIQSESHGSPGAPIEETAKWRCLCGASSNEDDVLTREQAVTAARLARAQTGVTSLGEGWHRVLQEPGAI